MMEKLWEEKIREYDPSNAIELENVLQELIQLHVLAALGRTKFFGQAQFQGGTSLRLLRGMNRFSQDLDFLLMRADSNFTWGPYLRKVLEICSEENLQFEVADRSASAGAVKKAILKTGFPRNPSLPFGASMHPGRKMRVNLEVDTNPPVGSKYETAYITFPVTTAITAQTLTSGFAMKLHALLCRKYVKGRDWYDFAWYVGHKITPDLLLLSAALEQAGPWSGEKVTVTAQSLSAATQEKICSIDWEEARRDVMRFLPAREQPALRAWTRDFFLYCVKQMETCLHNFNIS